MLLLQLIIIQAITFAALVFILRRLMYSSSAAETRRLKLLNEENIKRSQQLAKKLDEAELQCKEKILRTEEEIKKTKANAREEMDKLREDNLCHARQESRQIVEQAMNTKDRIREELEANLQGRVIGLSYKLIKDVLSQKSMVSFHEAIINEIIEELEKTDFNRIGIKADRGELISPYEIGRDKKKKIEGVFSKKTGRNMVCEEKIDKEIIAGVVIKLGNFVIDGSLRGRLKDAAGN